jgi:DNA-binding HxlR family transcriptional regulator
MDHDLDTLPWRSSCAVSCALELVGDSWTLLILRDLLLRGPCTFSELLSAPEGISTNILTARLAKLRRYGLIERRPGPSARSHHYALTDAGRDFGPVLQALATWSVAHLRPYQPDLTAAVPEVDPD